MPLSPEDVHKKTFTPVRLREGYDMGEVDQFLDEVETELTRLHAANDELQAKLGDGGGAAPIAVSLAKGESGPESDVESAARPSTAPTVTSVPQAAGAAARLLEIATQNADQLVGEAQEEADKIVGEARTSAERLESDSKTKADKLSADARSRAEQLDAETSERRKQLLGVLEEDKDSLARELDDLRAFEREYRSRLRSYFQSQLQALDGEGDGEVPLTPSRDKELSEESSRDNGAASPPQGSRGDAPGSQGNAPGPLQRLLAEEQQS